MQLRVFQRVFSHWPSLFVGLFVLVLLLSIVAFWGNYHVLFSVVTSTEVTVSTKLQFIGSLYGSLVSNQTMWSGAVAFATALLLGVVAAHMVYYLTVVRSAFSQRVSVASLGGLIVGFLGIGCAACGSLVLTAVLASVGSSALLLLPFAGVEIGILGIVLLLYAIVTIQKEISNGGTCQVY